MAFSKEKIVTVTVNDFIRKDAFFTTEFTDKDGNPCLIQVRPDRDCESPRKDYDHLWTWVTTKGAGYSDIKDDHPCLHEDDDGNLYKDFVKGNLIVRLYLYRHSGDVISIGSFGDPWDSGCIGFAYISKDKVSKGYGWKVITAKRREKLISFLQGEVEEMNAWISGSAYGIGITNLETEEEESCWGFICPERDDLKNFAADMLCGWIQDYKTRHEVAERLLG
jgi:hypothetical protein